MHPFQFSAAAAFAAGAALSTILLPTALAAAPGAVAEVGASSSLPSSSSSLATVPAASPRPSAAGPSIDGTAIAKTKANANPVSTALLNSLIAEAVRAHPKTGAARARVVAARQAIDAIPLWEDPMAGAGFMAADKMMRRDDGDIVLGIEQTLPKPGLYRVEKNRAAAEAGMAVAEEGVTASELSLAVARTVIELALSDDLIRLQSAEVDFTRSLVQAAVERSKNPDSTAVESLRLESELALLTQNLEAAVRQRGQTARSLNLLLLRPPESSWGPLTLPTSGANAAPSSAAALRVEMERRNPRLLALRQAMDVASAETEASRWKQKPTVSVGVETNTWSGGDFRSAMFSLKISLPWFNRKTWQAETARRSSLEAAARKDLEAELLEFSTRLTELLTTVENQSRLADSWQNAVIPRAEKSLTALQSAWLSSKSTLLEVLEAQRLLLNARQSCQRAAAAALDARQQLQALAGAFVPAVAPAPATAPGNPNSSSSSRP